MSSGNDEAVVSMVWQHWVKFVDDEKKQRVIDAAVKEKEAQIREYLKKKSADAKGILNRMCTGNDSALAQHVMTTWVTYFLDDKEVRMAEEQKATALKKFQNMNGKQKQNAHGVAARCIEQMDLNCMLRHFCCMGTGREAR